jgi:hypothetical protein
MEICFNYLLKAFGGGKLSNDVKNCKVLERKFEHL